MAKARRDPLGEKCARKLSQSIANSDTSGKFAADRTSDRDSNSMCARFLVSYNFLARELQVTFMLE